MCDRCTAISNQAIKDHSVYGSMPIAYMLYVIMEYDICMRASIRHMIQIIGSPDLLIAVKSKTMCVAWQTMVISYGVTLTVTCICDDTGVPGTGTADCTFHTNATSMHTENRCMHTSTPYVI